MPIERHWDGDEALLEYQELLTKPGTNADVTAHQQFVEIINRYAAIAAQSTLQLSLHAYDEAIRFKASKALVDWKLKLMELENQADPLTELIESLASKSDDENPNAHDLTPVVGLDADYVEGELVQDAPAPNAQSTPALLGAGIAANDPGAGAVTSNSVSRSADMPSVPDETTSARCDCSESPCTRRHVVGVPVVASSASSGGER